MRTVVFKDRSVIGWCGIPPRKDGIWGRIGRLMLTFRWERVVFEEPYAGDRFCNCRYSDADYDRLTDRVLRACDNQHDELAKEIRTIVIHARSDHA